MVLCDEALQSKRTLRWTLVNIFTHWRVSAFPTVIPMSCLYTQLVNCEGDYHFRIEVRVRATDDVIAHSDSRGPFSAPDRFSLHHIPFIVPHLHVPDPAVLDIVLLANGEEVDRQELNVEPRT